MCISVLASLWGRAKVQTDVTQVISQSHSQSRLAVLETGETRETPDLPLVLHESAVPFQHSPRRREILNVPVFMAFMVELWLV